MREFISKYRGYEIYKQGRSYVACKDGYDFRWANTAWGLVVAIDEHLFP